MGVARVMTANEREQNGKMIAHTKDEEICECGDQLVESDERGKAINRSLLVG